MIFNNQGIIIDKSKQNHTAEYISIDQKNIKTSSSVKLSGVHTGFPAGVEDMGALQNLMGGLSQYMGEAWGA